MKNRLQLRHSDHLFETRDAVVDYISSLMIYNDDIDLNSPRTAALFAEPLVFKYGEDETNPNIILAIGSYGSGVNDTENKYFIIDTATLEKDIEFIKTELGLEKSEISKIKDAIEALKQKDTELTTVLGQVGDALQFEIDRAKNEENSLRTDITANTEKIDAEIVRAEGKDNEHDTRINTIEAAVETEKSRAEAAEKSITIYTENTDTIKLNKVVSDTGTTISGALRVSSASGNQLKVVNDASGAGEHGGLYYNVNLEYNTGKLNLLVNGAYVGEGINLPLERFLKSAKYEPAYKNLILTFSVEGEEDEEVVINIGDLVDTYTAGLGLNLNSNEFSLKLNRAASENFVSLNDEGLVINGIQAAINTAVETEKSRAEAAEKANSDNIAANIAAISTLDHKIEDETNRAKEKETDLRTDIKRNTDAISELSGKTETNISELSGLTADVAALRTEDAALSNRIDTNSSSISGLTTDLNSTKNNLAAEITRATGEEGELNAAIAGIDAKVTLNTNHIHTLSESLTDEVNRASSAEAANATAISLLQAADETLGGDINLNKGLINTEKIRAESEEKRLQQAIDNEATTARSEENKLKNQIDSIVIPEYSIVKVTNGATSDSPYASEYFLSKDGATALGATITITKDQFLQNVEYNEETKILVFTFSTTDSGTKTISIPLADFADEYVAGDGLAMAGNEFRVKVNSDAESSKYLSVGNQGVKISGVDTAISNAVEIETDRAKTEEGRLRTDLDAEIAARRTADDVHWVTSDSPYSKTVELISGNSDGNITLQTQIRLAGSTITLPEGNPINQILGVYPDGTLFADGRTSNILHEVDDEGHKTMLDTELKNLERRLNDSEISIEEIRGIAQSAITIANDALSKVNNTDTALANANEALAKATEALEKATEALEKATTLETSFNTLENGLDDRISEESKNAIITSDVFKQKIAGDTDVEVKVDTTNKTVTIGLGANATIKGVNY